jgi:hypothetical protein
LGGGEGCGGGRQHEDVASDRGNGIIILLLGNWDSEFIYGI